jgi:diguanylate cyclase (GGDEF)-like protein
MSTRRVAPLLLATALLAASPARALDPQRQFRDYELQRWGVEHGLPQITVMSIAQDRLGYLWVGTQNGIARFDGLRFVKFGRDETGVDTSMASAAAVDPQGRIWFATPRGALRVVDQQVTELRADEDLLTVRDVAIGADGAPLFATERGIYRAQDERLVPAELAGTPSHALLVEGGAVWVGANGRLLRIADGEAHSYPLPRPTLNVSQLVRRGAELLLGTEAGVLRFDPKTGALRGAIASLGSAPVEQLAVDRDANLWVGTASALLRLAPDGRTEAIGSEVLDGRPWVNALFEDRGGDLWIGTRRESLYRARDAAVRTRSVRDGLDDSLVWSVLADGDGVLVGTNTSLMRLEASGRFAPVVRSGMLPNPSIYSLARAADGAVWVGTRGGLARLAGGALAVPPALEPLRGRPITAVLDRPEGLVVATLDGMWRLRGTRLETLLRPAGSAATRVRCVLALGVDDYLIGTEHGVRRVRGGAVEPLPWGRPLDASFVTTLHMLGPDLLAIGTLDSGLGLVRDGVLRIVTVADGLPSSNAWTLDAIGGELYAGSLDGIWRVALAALPDPRTAPHGPVAAETVSGSGYRERSVRSFACCNGGGHARSARDGRFLFYPTTEGVVRLDTSAIRPSPPPPRALVEGVLHEGRMRNGAAPFVLDAGARDLAIEYTGVTFVRAFALQFRYRLEGYDADWVESGDRRTAYYTHLPPGSYRFSIQARHPLGEWSEPSAALEVEVVAQLAERTWVRALAALALAALLALAWRWRLRALEARQRALEAAVADRTRELARANERLKVANQTLALENQTDPLTGLYNRRFVLANAFRSGGSARAEDRVAVLLLDLDDFKWINDTHGHGSGDRVLVELGDLLSSSVRAGDLVARWGGEEFLVVLPGSDESATLELAERIRRRVAGHGFRAEDERPLKLTVSAGFAHHVPRLGADEGLQLTLDLADAALYRAKQLGRNRVVGLRRVSADLPDQLSPSEAQPLVDAGRLAWIEPLAPNGAL